MGGDDPFLAGYTDSTRRIEPRFAEAIVSIVRVGMAEDNKFGDGYEAIFGKKKSTGQQSKRQPAKKSTAKKSTSAKSSGKKK